MTEYIAEYGDRVHLTQDCPRCPDTAEKATEADWRRPAVKLCSWCRWEYGTDTE